MFASGFHFGSDDEPAVFGGSAAGGSVRTSNNNGAPKVLSTIPEGQWVRSSEEDTAPLTSHNPVAGGGDQESTKSKKKRKEQAQQQQLEDSSHSSSSPLQALAATKKTSSVGFGGGDDDDEQAQEEEEEDSSEARLRKQKVAQRSADADLVDKVSNVVSDEHLCQRNPAMLSLRQEARDVRSRFPWRLGDKHRPHTPLHVILGRVTHTRISSFAACIIAILFVLRMRRPLLSSNVQKRVLDRQRDEEVTKAAKERVLSRKFYGASSRSMSLHLKKQRASMKAVLADGIQQSVRRLNITKFDRHATCAHSDESELVTHFHERDDPMKRSELFVQRYRPQEDKLFDRSKYKDDEQVTDAKKEMPLYLRRTSFVNIVDPMESRRRSVAGDAPRASFVGSENGGGDADQQQQQQQKRKQDDDDDEGDEETMPIEKSQSVAMREFGEFLFEDSRQNIMKSENDVFSPQPALKRGSGAAGSSSHLPGVLPKPPADVISSGRKLTRSQSNLLEEMRRKEAEEEAAAAIAQQTGVSAVAGVGTSTATDPTASARQSSPKQLHDIKDHRTKTSLAAKASAGTLPATRNIHLWSWCWKDEPFEPPHPSLPSLSAAIAATGNKRERFTLAERDATKYVTQVRGSELAAFTSRAKQHGGSGELGTDLVEDLVQLRNCFASIDPTAKTPAQFDPAAARLKRTVSNVATLSHSRRKSSTTGAQQQQNGQHLQDGNNEKSPPKQQPRGFAVRKNRQSLGREALVATKTSASFEPFALHFGMEHSQFVRRSIKELGRQIDVHRHIYNEKRERLMGETAELRAGTKGTCCGHGWSSARHHSRDDHNHNDDDDDDHDAQDHHDEHEHENGEQQQKDGFNRRHHQHIQSVDFAVRKQLTDQCDTDIRQYAVAWFERLRRKVAGTMNGGLTPSMEKVFSVFEPVFRNGILTPQLFEKTVVLQLYGRALLEKHRRNSATNNNNFSSSGASSKNQRAGSPSVAGGGGAGGGAASVTGVARDETGSLASGPDRSMRTSPRLTSIPNNAHETSSMVEVTSTASASGAPLPVPPPQTASPEHYHRRVTSSISQQNQQQHQPVTSPTAANANDDAAFTLHLLDGLVVAPTNDECVLVDLNAQFALMRLRIPFGVSEAATKDLIVRSGAQFALMDAREVDLIFRNTEKTDNRRAKVQRLGKLEEVIETNNRIERMVEEGRLLAERRIRERRQLGRIITGRGPASARTGGGNSSSTGTHGQRGPSPSAGAGAGAGAAPQTARLPAIANTAGSGLVSRR